MMGGAAKDVAGNDGTLAQPRKEHSAQRPSLCWQTAQQYWLHMGSTRELWVFPCTPLVYRARLAFSHPAKTSRGELPFLAAPFPFLAGCNSGCGPWLRPAGSRNETPVRVLGFVVKTGACPKKI